MPHEMYDERIRAHQPQIYAWERQMADGVTLADLNEKHIRGCIRLGIEGGRIPAHFLLKFRPNQSKSHTSHIPII